MSVTINVNGLSLCHQGSGGVAMATLPDMCKTPMPGGPVPLPYPNIARSADLQKGTQTVNADGGHSIAIKGSEFSKSTGDEPGTVGGVISSTQLKEATWLSYSFDVLMDGQNACRLTDKMLMNHGNTACLGGLLQPPLEAWATSLNVLPEIQHICDIKCECQSQGGGQQCITNKLRAEEAASNYTSTIKAEPPFDMMPDLPSPIMSRNDPRRTTQSKPRGSRIPDAVIVERGDRPPTAGNIKAVVEIKLGADDWNKGQKEAYETIAGRKDRLVLVDETNCKCPEREKQPEPSPVTVPVPETKHDNISVGSVIMAVGVIAVAAIAAAAAVAAAPAVAAAVGGALVLGGVSGMANASTPSSKISF